MPPEYTMSGHVSEKTDSFAFGMVLLELLAGRPPRETAELYTMEPGKQHRMLLFVPIISNPAAAPIYLSHTTPRDVAVSPVVLLSQISFRRWSSSSRTRAPATGHAAS
jgi:serine/threonine protein kinase